MSAALCEPHTEKALVDKIRDIRWNIVAPIGFFAVALFAVAWFSLTTGGDAEPAPPLGAIGTPIRGTFIPPTPRLPGAEPKATPRAPVFGVRGTPEERDARRRSDLLILFDALRQLHDREDEYPTTGNNVQTLCAFKELDAGCALTEILGETLPADPFEGPIENGYWYSSDGQSFKIYASLEIDLAPGQACQTSDATLLTKPNVICLSFP